MSNEKNKKGKPAEFESSEIEPGADWIRGDRTQIKNKVDGFAYRHVITKNVMVLEQSGWVIDTTNPSMLPDNVVMRLPQHRMDARRRSLARQNQANADSVNDPSKIGPTAFRCGPKGKPLKE